nr:ATP-binding protein [Ramlibacter aurantiacus]
MNKEITDLVARLPGASGRVRLELGGLPYVQCRPSSRRRTLFNLLDNALRHGSGLVEVQSSLEQGWIVVRIADHGPGLSEGELAQLSQPFDRATMDRQRSPFAELSLLVASREVEQERGELRVLRRADGGLWVELWLRPARLTEGEGPGD